MTNLLLRSLVLASALAGCAYGDGSAPADTAVPNPGQAIYYVDADGDSHGNAATGAIYDVGSNPAGTVTLGDDCDDRDASVWATCDTTAPPQDLVYCYDGDGDGYVSAACASFPEGSQPPGWIQVATTDCDDSDRSRSTDCSDPIVDVDDGGLGANEVRVQVGDPSVIVVGANIASRLENEQVATATGGYFFVPAIITPGRMNPDQELGLRGYGLGGEYDWQTSLIDLVPTVNENGSLIGFGQGLPEGIYRVNCAAEGQDDNVWCDLELLESSSAWTIDFMECELPKQSLCLRVERDGTVTDSEADCLGLYVSPEQCEDGGGDTIIPEPDPDQVQCHTDLDNDNYGVGAATWVAGTTCGHQLASVGGDCNDSRADVYPGRTELPNGRDDDCDGTIDEDGVGGGTTCSADADRDGYGHRSLTVSSPDADCNDPGEADDTTDCDDADSDNHPGHAEVLGDGEDNDCDGAIDEEVGGGGGGTCTVRATFNGDSSVEGDSSYYAEIYGQPFDGGSALGGRYWPTDLNWSDNNPSDFTEVLSVTNGGTSTGSMSDVADSFDYVIFQGGVWQASGGGGFIRWVYGAAYGDFAAGDLSAEFNCGGAYSSMSCVRDGNDWRCSR